MATWRLMLGLIAAAVVAIGAAAVVPGSARPGSADSYDSYMYRMLGSGYAYRPDRPAPVTDLAAARADAQRFANHLGLRVAGVLEFRNNFYVKLNDHGGRAATEGLVDPQTGMVSIEYGPAMMWNTRYGVGRAAQRMMGSYSYGYSGTGGSAAGTVSVSTARAHTLAQRWLDANEPGTRVESGADAFPGYYTLETLRGGRISGMISVNAGTGAVWPHWWHGAFIAGWKA